MQIWHIHSHIKLSLVNFTPTKSIFVAYIGISFIFIVLLIYISKWLVLLDVHSHLTYFLYIYLVNNAIPVELRCLFLCNLVGLISGLVLYIFAFIKSSWGNEKIKQGSIFKHHTLLTETILCRFCLIKVTVQLFLSYITVKKSPIGRFFFKG